MVVLNYINITLCILLFLCYFYQFIFIFVSYLKKRQAPPTDTLSKIAVLIAAKDEEKYIARLISSLDSQDYPKDKYSVFVVADNCEDATAEVARRAGATVYERRDEINTGKGFALDFLIKSIYRDCGAEAFDAFVVFDADNTLKSDFLTEINKTFALGYDCVTSYRASTNYSDSWVSAGQGMCFLRDMVLLNRARMALGSCSFVSGTGYLFSRKLVDAWGGGWPHHTLTEDCEFTMYMASGGYRSGYSDTAVFYDEQPKKLYPSLCQRLRWCRGGLQVFVKYFSRLIKGLFTKRGFASFDMSMCMAPAYIISVAATLVNTVGSAIALAFGADPLGILSMLGIGMLVAYSALFIFGAVLTVSEWKMLQGSAFKKILYAFTFPIFMFTFVPVALVALFKKDVKWYKVR